MNETLKPKEMKHFSIILSILVFTLTSASAQSRATLKGVVSDKTSGETLLSANISLTPKDDADGRTYTTSGLDGSYTFKNVEIGEYWLEVTYIGFKDFKQTVKIREAKVYEEAIRLTEDSQQLAEVSVTGRAIRAEQKGDSIMYNAEAFKVLEGSSAEDLLAKMPGIVVEGGAIQAQGESVQKILVDGKEFFEGDVNLAIRSIPSDVISSIEVFDKKSDQAEFTGFDDGEEIKTINIRTKTGYKTGTFGEIYAGYGTDDRYKAGGNMNVFNDDARISILGMSNNVNIQNFSQEDLAGVMSTSSGGGRRGSGGGGPSGGGRGNNASSNFMVSNLGGVTASNGLGFNYVDEWTGTAGTMKFTGSYFLNQSENDIEQYLDRAYFESSMPGMTYEEYNEAVMNNWNHRINMNLDYSINDRNSIQFRPYISFQDNESLSFMQGVNLEYGTESSETETNTSTTTDAYNMGGQLVYRHRFDKTGRTISVMGGGNMTNTESESYTDYINNIYGNNPQEDIFSQYKPTSNNSYSLKGNVMFTESLTRSLQLSTGYKASFSNSDIDRKVYVSDGLTDIYEQLDESLSNQYTSDYLTQAGNVGLRYFSKDLMFMANADVQVADLLSEQIYPQVDQLNNRYVSVLPMMMSKYTINDANTLMLRYRSNSIAPSVSELQNVIDNSNTLFLSTGNPNLDQQINHSLNFRYVYTGKTGQTFIAMLGGTMRQNYIGDSTYIATEDQQLTETITLNKGAQFTKPTNLNGYYSLQSMMTYGLPVDAIRSNINFSISANYANVPTIFNGVESNTRELVLVPKVIVGSNISRNLDFTLSYASNINKAYSSLADALGGDYINHNAAAKVGWTIWNGITLRSTFDYQGYTGLDTDNSHYFIWGASLGKKLLKSKALEVKVEATDILQQNLAFQQNVGSNYYDYVNSNVLQSYGMLTLVYTIR